MAKLNTEDIKKLRELTGAGVLDVKKALDEFGEDFEKVKKDLMEKGKAKAAKKADRDASDGLVYSYIHNEGKVGSLILMACETDFVAKTDDFQNLCKEVAMQVCTGDYESVGELLKDDYMRDGEKKVKDLITEAIAKLGENIELREFTKYSVRG
jgi:elongation factor Ts